MDIEILFTEQRWNILKALSEKKYSPLQLAEKSNTTMANISQQLRLLEASDIVKKEKISNRDKGKPRSLFSLTRDQAYVITAAKGFTDKKLINLDKFHNIMFRSMFIKDSDLKYYIEKFLWSIEKHVSEIELLAIKSTEHGIKVILASNADKKIPNITIKNQNNESKEFKVEVVSCDEALKLAKNNKGIFSGQVEILYDPDRVLSKIIEER